MPFQLIRPRTLLLPRLSTTHGVTRHVLVKSRHIHIFRSVEALRERRRQILLNGQTVGLVPTMGALHRGHLSLVRRAAAENDHVFVTIYVNPTQFGLNEDLDSYPKTWDDDLRRLQDLDAELAAAAAGNESKHVRGQDHVAESGRGRGHASDHRPKRGRIDAVFAPTTKTMYPTLPPDSSLPGVGTFVQITPVANLLEGKSRPVFFRGVATVCAKLFNIATPDAVYFGQKDVQQTVIIKRLVKDLHFDTRVMIVPTEREEDGLAMSSRNVYLGERRRRVGVTLFRALSAAMGAYADEGKRSRDEILAAAWAVANRVIQEQSELGVKEGAMFEVDYLSLADPDTLEEIDVVDDERGAVLSGAIKMLPLTMIQSDESLGQGEDKLPVRLIDNMIIEPNPGNG